LSLTIDTEIVKSGQVECLAFYLGCPCTYPQIKDYGGSAIAPQPPPVKIDFSLLQKALMQKAIMQKWV
ncbi:hypothetical protein, partial [Limnoraphis robusta]